WGSKHPDRLDFGEVEMPWKHKGWFTREDWLAQKLANTRFYDRGKDKKPFEKLKMPQFGFLLGPDVHPVGPVGPIGSEHPQAPDLNGEDREAVMTFVMSLTKDTVLPSIQRTLAPAEAAVERGKQIVRNKNCFGCHVLYGEGGDIRRFIDEYAVKTANG